MLLGLYLIASGVIINIGKQPTHLLFALARLRRQDSLANIWLRGLAWAADSKFLSNSVNDFYFFNIYNDLTSPIKQHALGGLSDHKTKIHS